MRVLTRVVLLAVVCGPLLPRQAAAQERHGVWFGVSLGPGSAGVRCTECIFNDRRGAGALILNGGWTLTPRTLVGVEVDVWTQGAPDLPNSFTIALTLANVSGTLTYYPSRTSGFFVKGGAGVAIADFDAHLDGKATTINLGKGPGVIAGAGYELRKWRRVSLTAGVDYWYGRIGDVNFLGSPLGRDWTQNIVAATVGIAVP
jgi:hypothetical protein